MSLLEVPPGASVQMARDRLRADGFWLPERLTDGIDPATSNWPNLDVTSSATPNAAGAYSEVVSALSADVGWVRITQVLAQASAATDNGNFMDLAVGAAGSELVKIANLAVGWVNVTNGVPPTSWMFPLWISRGLRVAIRTRSVTASKVGRFRIEFFKPTHGLRPSDSIITIGADTSATKGVTLTNPASNNADGAWTQITAATAEPLTALGVSIGGGADTTQTAGTAIVDIAKGASGSEVEIISDLFVNITVNEQVNLLSSTVFPVDVPAGTRLAARWRGSAFSGSTLDAILYGIRKAA